jgi:hypothetical protein
VEPRASRLACWAGGVSRAGQVRLGQWSARPRRGSPASPGERVPCRTLRPRPPHVFLRFGRPLPLLVSDGARRSVTSPHVTTGHGEHLRCTGPAGKTRRAPFRGPEAVGRWWAGGGPVVGRWWAGGGPVVGRWWGGWGGRGHRPWYRAVPRLSPVSAPFSAAFPLHGSARQPRSAHSARPQVPLVARLHACRSALTFRPSSRHVPLRCVTPALGSSGAVCLGELEGRVRAMVGINSQEGQPSMCGAVVRRWLAGSNGGQTASNTGDNTGRNTGSNARKASGDATSNTRARRSLLLAEPLEFPERAARAPSVSRLRCLRGGRASVKPARCAGGLRSPEPPTPDAGALNGPSSHASTVPVMLACSTAPRAAPRVRPCSSAKLRIRLDPSWWCQKSTNKSNYAYCPTAPGLGTLGGMSHATPAARQRTHRAPTLPTGKGRARTCPNLPSDAQRCPARPVALPVVGRLRDNLSRAVRHDGCPRYAGRLDVASTRSATLLRAPGVRAAGTLRHGGARAGDRRAPSNLQQSGELQP